MIRITDMTLSCLDEYSPSRIQLTELLKLLLCIGVDVIELTEYAYNTIGDLPENGKYSLRVKNIDSVSSYYQFNSFVCRKASRTDNMAIISEIQANDIREINFLSQFGALENIRITGLDDILNHDYEKAFSNIKKQINGKIELCPENNYHCATAIAVEWAINGGTNIVTAFAGLNGKAPTEEVLMTLRIAKRYKTSLSFAVFPQIAELISEIISQHIPDRKAVIGKDIFDVESGIHVDGIIKNPLMYEPFSPELVGNNRRIVIGKHSGRKAIEMKLSELGLISGEYDIVKILENVKDKSVEKASSLTDIELLEIADGCKNL